MGDFTRAATGASRGRRGLRAGMGGGVEGARARIWESVNDSSSLSSYFYTLTGVKRIPRSRCTNLNTRTRGPTRSRKDLFGLVDRRTRTGAGSLLCKHASVVALNLVGGHEHAILVATQDWRLVEGGEGEGFESCVSTRLSTREGKERNDGLTLARRRGEERSASVIHNGWRRW